MSSGSVFERLFKLLACIMKLVVDCKRDPFQVCETLQRIVDEKQEGNAFQQNLGTTDTCLSRLLTPLIDLGFSAEEILDINAQGLVYLGDLLDKAARDLSVSFHAHDFSSRNIAYYDFRETILKSGVELPIEAGAQVIEAYRVLRAQRWNDFLMSRLEVFLIPTQSLNLSVRARKVLITLSIFNIGQLVRLTPDNLLECRTCGWTSVHEINGKLRSHGVWLGMKLNDEVWRKVRNEKVSTT